MKYRVSTVNIGKLLIAFMLLFTCFPLIGFGILNEIGWKENLFIFIMILLIGPLTFITLVWLSIKRGKDVFTVSNIGIETEKHGVINWKEIKVCSFENIYGQQILLILKNAKWLSITYSERTSESIDILTGLFNDIKSFQNKLPQKHALNFGEDKVYRFFHNLNFALIILFIVSIIVVNIIKELVYYFK